MASSVENLSTPSQTSGLAIASLVLSIFSIVLGPLGCIPGIICGHLAKSKMKKDPAVQGAGLAQAGLIVGYTFLGIFALVILLVISPLFTIPR